MSTAHRVRPARGHELTGDAVVVHRGPDFWLFAIVDALGHGPSAAASADAVAAAARAQTTADLRRFFAAADGAVAQLRAVVLAAISLTDAGEATFAGIGNIELLGPKGKDRPFSRPGVVGRGLKGLKVSAFSPVAGERYVMASDGLSPRRLAKALDEVAPQSAELAAQAMFDAAGRDDDDASVLVLDFFEERRP